MTHFFPTWSRLVGVFSAGVAVGDGDSLGLIDGTTDKVGTMDLFGAAEGTADIVDAAVGTTDKVGTMDLFGAAEGTADIVDAAVNPSIHSNQLWKSSLLLYTHFLSASVGDALFMLVGKARVVIIDGDILGSSPDEWAEEGADEVAPTGAGTSDTESSPDGLADWESKDEHGLCFTHLTHPTISLDIMHFVNDWHSGIPDDGGTPGTLFWDKGRRDGYAEGR
jgi:hypothetical protein